MRIRWARGIAVALLGTAASVGWAQQPAGTSQDTGKSWFGSLFTDERSKPAAKAEAVPVARPSVASSIKKAQEERAQQRADYMRRLQVCDRLRQIALEGNDMELERQADELEARARQVYKDQSARPTPAEVAQAKLLEEPPPEPKSKQQPRAEATRGRYKGDFRRHAASAEGDTP